MVDRSSLYTNILSSIKNYNTDLWAKHIWDATLKLYKAILVEWNKGTGGGSMISTEF